MILCWIGIHRRLFVDGLRADPERVAFYCQRCWKGLR